MDTGLSDNRLLLWNTTFPRKCSPVTSCHVRERRRLDKTQLIQQLRLSALCGDPGSFPDDIDEMAALYKSTLVDVVNSLLPNITSHPYRYKQPWFDVECTREKRHLTRLRRVMTGQELKTATRSYLRLLRSKRRALFSRLLSASLLLGCLLTVSISTQVKQMQYGSVLTPRDTLSPQYHYILMELMLFHRRRF